MKFLNDLTDNKYAILEKLINSNNVVQNKLKIKYQSEITKSFSRSGEYHKFLKNVIDERANEFMEESHKIKQISRNQNFKNMNARIKFNTNFSITQNFDGKKIDEKNNKNSSIFGKLNFYNSVKNNVEKEKDKKVEISNNKNPNKIIKTNFNESILNYNNVEELNKNQDFQEKKILNDKFKAVKTEDYNHNKTINKDYCLEDKNNLSKSPKLKSLVKNKANLRTESFNKEIKQLNQINFINNLEKKFPIEDCLIKSTNKIETSNIRKKDEKFNFSNKNLFSPYFKKKIFATTNYNINIKNNKIKNKNSSKTENNSNLDNYLNIKNSFKFFEEKPSISRLNNSSKKEKIFLNENNFIKKSPKKFSLSKKKSELNIKDLVISNVNEDLYRIIHPRSISQLSDIKNIKINIKKTKIFSNLDESKINLTNKAENDNNSIKLDISTKNSNENISIIKSSNNLENNFKNFNCKTKLENFNPKYKNMIKEFLSSNDNKKKERKLSTSSFSLNKKDLIQYFNFNEKLKFKVEKDFENITLYEDPINENKQSKRLNNLNKNLNNIDNVYNNIKNKYTLDNWKDVKKTNNYTFNTGNFDLPLCSKMIGK